MKFFKNTQNQLADLITESSNIDKYLEPILLKTINQICQLNNLFKYFKIILYFLQINTCFAGIFLWSIKEISFLLSEEFYSNTKMLFSDSGLQQRIWLSSEIYLCCKYGSNGLRDKKVKEIIFFWPLPFYWGVDCSK